MALDRRVAQIEPAGYFGVGQALGDQTHHLKLALAEVPGYLGGRFTWRGPAAEVLDKAAGDRRRQEGIAC